MITQELLEKHNLVASSTWAEIRSRLLVEIENLSVSDIDSVELKGLLRAVKIVDSWESKYQAQIKNNEE